MRQPDEERLTIAERIRSMFDELTRAERQLANAFLENYPVSGLGSISTIAETAGVSTPTVVRMAKKLGLRGFPELQAALRAELEEIISNPISKHDRWTESAAAPHLLDRFADACTQNLRQTLRQISPELFNAVVALLADRNRTIYAVGGRITRALADYFFTHMQVIRDGMTLIAPNANSWPHYVLSMKAGDVLVMFDIRRYERSILQLAEMARSRGVEIILLTDQWGSPAAKCATHSIHCRIEAPSAWDSCAVIMLVIEAVIAAVQTMMWDEAKDRITTLEQLFDRTKMFRKFT